MHARGFVYSLLLASAAAVGMASTAYSFTLTDDPSVAGTLTNTIYYGGNNTYNGADIIGTSPPFSILDAVVTRTGSGVGSSLNIIINTNFAGAPGTTAADGTVYGSLFLTPGFWTPSGTAATNYSTDNYANASPNNNREWSYAVTNPTGVTGNANPVGLYAIGTTPVATNYPSSSVPQYFTTTGGKVYMSYIGGNGDPTLGDPVNPNNGLTFRAGQAVQFAPNGAAVLGTSATFTVGSGFVEYSIVDNALFGNSFALSWAMTCANDITQGQVTLANNDLIPTPLPAALPLFAGGLGVMGLLARRRKRKAAGDAAA